MKKKSIFSVPIIVIFFCLIISLCSCENDDNPIKPSNDPVIIDSNLFDWHFDTIYTIPGSNMYIADTNKIFLPGYPYSVYFNNGSIQYINHNDNDFGAECANGTNVNNVYIGGTSISNYRSILKKWNGNGIENIIMPIDTSNKITRIEIISENNIWISTLRNIIYHYSNQTFTTYRLDSGLIAGIVFKDNNQNLFAQFGKFSTGEYDYIYMFKLLNSSWVLILKDSINENTEIGDFIGFSEGYILRSGKSSIYYFNGNIWEKYINLGNNLRPFIAAGGESRTNMMFRASINSSQDYIFYYNGMMIYRTPSYFLPYPNVREICFKFDRFYLSINHNEFINYLGMAKLKKYIQLKQNMKKTSPCRGVSVLWDSQHS